MTFLPQHFDDATGSDFMALLCGAHKVIVVDVKVLPANAELIRDLVGVSLRRNTGLLGARATLEPCSSVPVRK
jgi:hypothetical protein